jgi:hypothetical protein
MQALDRARGALYGLAIGDALGMPAEMQSRAEVVARWGPLLPGFEAAPPGHRLADGLPAGSVTDDTEQAVLLGRLLVRDRGEIDPREWAAALVDWERDMAARRRRQLLPTPSTPCAGHELTWRGRRWRAIVMLAGLALRNKARLGPPHARQEALLRRAFDSRRTFTAIIVKILHRSKRLRDLS